MSSVLQNQLLKVEKGLLVCCLEGKGQIGRREGKRSEIEEGEESKGQEERGTKRSKGRVRLVERREGKGLDG